MDTLFDGLRSELPSGITSVDRMAETGAGSTKLRMPASTPKVNTC